MKDLWKLLEPFWKWLGLPGTAAMFGFLAVVGPMLWKYLTELWILCKQRKQLRDLHPFYTEQEILYATQYYIETKCQSIAPSKDEEPGRTHAFAPREDIIPFFLNKALKPANTDECRFYIVLADSGMGKTTFLINLYLRYINQFVKPPYQIRLFPLGYPNIDKKIEKISDEDKKNTILLLDAFDEDIKAVQDYRTRLQAIIKLVSEFREVVITCRTQFFPSEEEEPKETGVLRFGPKGGQHVFRKLYLSPFDEKDIQTYLTKRFPWFQRAKRRKAQQIVMSCPNLMVRPMLLSYIEDLLQNPRPYTATYMVYAELINKWVERETDKAPSGRNEHYMKELYQFSRDIAVDLYRCRVERQGSLMMSSKDIQPFAEKHDITLSVMEMKSKSLLNRNAYGEYKFSHKSVMEYFLAEEAFFNEDFRKELDFEGMDQAEVFFNEMIWKELTVPFFSQSDVSGEYSIKDGKVNILTKLPEKLLSEVTYLTLYDWKTSDKVLLFRSMKHLKSLGLGTQMPTEQHQELKQLLPACQVFRLISKAEAQKVFGLTHQQRKSGGREYNLLCPSEYIQNNYENKGKVVIDHATGLMWQKSGSEERLTYQDTESYIKKLNKDKFTGYADWRLPTIPELMSLLEPTQKNDDLYIDPIFDATQFWCWSADRLTEGGSSSAAWDVHFTSGSVDWNHLGYEYYVRAVRS